MTSTSFREAQLGGYVTLNNCKIFFLVEHPCWQHFVGRPNRMGYEWEGEQPGNVRYEVVCRAGSWRRVRHGHRIQHSRTTDLASTNLRFQVSEDGTPTFYTTPLVFHHPSPSLMPLINGRRGVSGIAIALSQGKRRAKHLTGGEVHRTGCKS